MRILVTGGAGYLGAVLCGLLLERGHTVRVLDTLERGPWPLQEHERLRLIRGDLREASALGEALSGAQAVVHLAAVSGRPACDREPSLARSVNVQGTRELMRAAGPSRTVIFASTGSVYGAVPDGLCTEAGSPSPLTLYGRTKLEAEDEVLGSPSGVVLRFATCYGVSPRMRTDLLVNHFVQELIQRGEVEVYEPDARRTFLHVRDAARAIELALERPAAIPGSLMNVGDEDQNRSKRELLELIKAELPGSVVRYGASGSDPDRRDYAVSYERARSFGFRATVSLRDGIRELVRALSRRTAPA